MDDDNEEKVDERDLSELEDIRFQIKVYMEDARSEFARSWDPPSAFRSISFRGSGAWVSGKPSYDGPESDPADLSKMTGPERDKHANERHHAQLAAGWIRESEPLGTVDGKRLWSSGIVYLDPEEDHWYWRINPPPESNTVRSELFLDPYLLVMACKSLNMKDPKGEILVLLASSACAYVFVFPDGSMAVMCGRRSTSGWGIRNFPWEQRL